VISGPASARLYRRTNPGFQVKPATHPWQRWCTCGRFAPVTPRAGVPRSNEENFTRNTRKVPCRNHPLVPRFTGILRSDRVRGDEPCPPRNFPDKDAADKGRQGGQRAVPKTVRRNRPEGEHVRARHERRSVSPVAFFRARFFVAGAILFAV